MYVSTYASSQSSCYMNIGGAFNMRPYQFVIGAGVLIYIHTMVTSMYYLLPVDDDNQKYIPGILLYTRYIVINTRMHSPYIVQSAEFDEVKTKIQ